MFNISMKILFIILSYLLGSIPWGFIFGKLHGIDIRTVGSKNIGATNTGRILGKRYAVYVYFLDALKGAIPVILFRYAILPYEWCLLSPMLLGFVAIIGHTYPIFLKFKGGKAVSSASGVAGSYCIWVLIICFSIFVIITKTTKYVSLGSIIGSIFLIICSILFAVFSGDLFTNVFSTPTSGFWPINIWYPIFSLLIASVIIIRHKTNINRLVKKEENKVSW